MSGDPGADRATEIRLRISVIQGVTAHEKTGSVSTWAPAVIASDWFFMCIQADRRKLACVRIGAVMTARATAPPLLERIGSNGQAPRIKPTASDPMPLIHKNMEPEHGKENRLSQCLDCHRVVAGLATFAWTRRDNGAAMARAVQASRCRVLSTWLAQALGVQLVVFLLDRGRPA